MRSELSQPNASIEKRRLICTEECYCESGERSVRARLRDLSGQGAFVRTADPFPIGDRLHLKFQLEGKWVKATGVVRHSELGYGMGIQFLAIQPGHRQTLESYLSALRHRLGSAAYSRVRRVPRITYRAKVRVRGKNAEGKRFSEDAETLDVSEIGARLMLRNRVSPGELLALQVVSNGGGSWAQFRIVWQGVPGTSLERDTGLEQTVVDLWGIYSLSDE